MGKRKKPQRTAIVRADVSEADLETFRNLIPETIVVSAEQFDALVALLDAPANSQDQY
jgi:hypothetical protein